MRKTLLAYSLMGLSFLNLGGQENNPTKTTQNNKAIEQTQEFEVNENSIASLFTDEDEKEIYSTVYKEFQIYRHLELTANISEEFFNKTIINEPSNSLELITRLADCALKDEEYSSEFEEGINEIYIRGDEVIDIEAKLVYTDHDKPIENHTLIYAGDVYKEEIDLWLTGIKFGADGLGSTKR